MTVFPGFEGVKGVLRGHIYPRGVAEGVNKPQKTPFTPENPWKKGNSQILETLRHGKNVEQIAFFNFGLERLRDFNVERCDRKFEVVMKKTKEFILKASYVFFFYFRLVF